MFKLFSSLCSQVVLSLAVVLPVTAVQAGSYSVSPVRSYLSTTKKVDALTITNQGDQATVVQMQLMQWHQHEGKDIYSDTRGC